VVGGVSCDNQAKPEEDKPSCFPGTLGFFSFDPQTSTWQMVPAPPVGEDRTPGNDGGWGRAIDAVADQAVFSVGSHRVALGLDNVWSDIPALPFPRAVTECAAGGRLYAFWPVPGETIGPEVQSPTGPLSMHSTNGFQVASIGPDFAKWSELPTISAPLSIENFPDLLCSDTSVLVYSHSLDSVWSLDAASKQWVHEPPAPADLTTRPGLTVPGFEGRGKDLPYPPGFDSRAWTGKNYAFWNPPSVLDIPADLQKQLGIGPQARRDGNALVFDPVSHIWAAATPGQQGSTVYHPHSVAWVDGFAFIATAIGDNPGLETYLPK
jgi:hypothetical protein